jgi:hypothetical protein
MDERKERDKMEERGTRGGGGGERWVREGGFGKECLGFEVVLLTLNLFNITYAVALERNVSALSSSFSFSHSWAICTGDRRRQER